MRNTAGCRCSVGVSGCGTSQHAIDGLIILYLYYNSYIYGWNVDCKVVAQYCGKTCSLSTLLLIVDACYD